MSVSGRKVAILHGVLAAEQQHVVLRVLQFAGRQGPELARDLTVCIGRLVRARPVYQAHRGLEDRFGRDAVGPRRDLLVLAAREFAGHERRLADQPPNAADGEGAERVVEGWVV